MYGAAMAGAGNIVREKFTARCLGLAHKIYFPFIYIVVSNYS